MNHPTEGPIKAAYWPLKGGFREMLREAADRQKKKKKTTNKQHPMVQEIILKYLMFDR